MTDYDLQQQLINQRRQQYAQQGQFQAPQGQMVGNQYIAPNALQYLAAGLRSYGAQRGEQLATQDLKNLQNERTAGNQKAMAEFLRQSQGAPAEVLAEGVQGPARPAQGPDMKSAYAALLQAPDQSLRQSGMQGMMQIPEMQARAAEKQEDRAFRSEQAELNRAQQTELARQRAEDQRQIQQDRLQAQREMRQLVASTRQAPQAQIIQTEAGPMQLVGGRAVPIIGPEGTPVSAPIRGQQQGLSATAQKELFEADDAVQAGLGAVSSLNQALDLNNKAYSGVGASTRAKIVSNLPGQSDAADATIAMENMIGQQALSSLKSIFGGNPTEGERAILLDLQASPSKTPRQREEIIKRSIDLANKRIQFNQNKADALREGTYMKSAPAQNQNKSSSVVDFGSLK